MKSIKKINVRRLRRSRHVRNKLRGDADRPRLTVNRSHRNIACQVVNDEEAKTLVSAGTKDADIKGSFKFGGNKDAAAAVGKAIAEKALAAGIQAVRFDRGAYKYHGRVAALADAAREAGLKL